MAYLSLFLTNLGSPRNINAGRWAKDSAHSAATAVPRGRAPCKQVRQTSWALPMPLRAAKTILATLSRHGLFTAATCASHANRNRLRHRSGGRPMDKRVDKGITVTTIAVSVPAPASRCRIDAKEQNRHRE